MLLGIQKLIEYFNRNYFKDDKIEEKMITMTKTLYDPEVEKKGREEKAIEIAQKLLDILGDDIIAEKTGLSVEEVKKLTVENGDK